MFQTDETSGRVIVRFAPGKTFSNINLRTFSNINAINIRTTFGVETGEARPTTAVPHQSKMPMVPRVAAPGLADADASSAGGPSHP